MILNVSYDLLLLETRSEILRAAGCSVAPAESLSSALMLLRRSVFDLTIVGHSIPEADAHLILMTAQAMGTPVLLMTRAAEIPCGDADLILPATDGPHAFLHGVETLLRRRAVM